MTRVARIALIAGLACAAVARADVDSRPIAQRSDSPAAAPSATGPSVTRIAGSLAVVAGLIVAVGYGYRRLSASTATGGGAAVTLVSRTVLTPKHQVMVLRVGGRLVVVGDAGHGMQPLCEVTDPAEVKRVLVAAGVADADDDPVKAGAFAAAYAQARSKDADAA